MIETGASQLNEWVPIGWAGGVFAEPVRTLEQPLFSQLIRGMPDVVIAEMSTTARANLMIGGRHIKLIIPANRAGVFLVHLEHSLWK